MAQSTAEAVRAPAMPELLRAQSVGPTGSTPEAKRAPVVQGRERRGEVVLTLGIKLEQRGRRGQAGCSSVGAESISVTRRMSRG